ERQPVEGESHSGHRGCQAVSGPLAREKIHAQAGQELVQQTENSQRPGQGKQEVEQGTGIKRQGVPLGQKRKSAIIQRIPKRYFPMPKVLLMIIGQGIAEISKVAEE